MFKPKRETESQEYRRARFSTFVYVSLGWPNYLQYHPSGKNSFEVSDWQQGIIKCLHWTFLSSQITDPPRGNIRMLLNLSIQLYGGCGLVFG